MIKFTAFLLLHAAALTSFSQQEQVYFAQSIGEKGIILEDHITFKNNLDSWGKGQYGVNYTAYGDYMKNIAKKYAAYDDTLREYFFDGYKPEFAKLTDIKIGDRFYFASGSDVYLSEVTGYYIRMDDEIGGGNIFYALLKNPKESNEQDVKFQDYELLVCTKNGNMSRINRTGVTDAGEREKFKKILMPKLKKVKLRDEKSQTEKWISLSSIDEPDLKIFRAPFANASDASGKLIDLYVVSYCKQVSFDAFACGIWIMDKDGKVLKEFSKLAEKEFGYSKIFGIIDVNGDGIYEVITEDGYYEGIGYSLFQHTGTEFTLIAGGFNFGV